MEHILDLLLAVLPSGGLGVLLGWLVSAKLRKARDEAEVSNIYQGLYGSLKETLSGQTDEITQLQQHVLSLQHEHLRLRQLVSQARICRYWGAHCPIRRQLQDEADAPVYTPRFAEPHAAPRQHERSDEVEQEARQSARAAGADSSALDEPP